MSSDTVKFFTSTLYFSSGCNFHLFLCWSSSDILLSSDWILGLALSYAVCIYEIRHWAWPLPMQFEHMGSIGPHSYRFTFPHQLFRMGIMQVSNMKVCLALRGRQRRLRYAHMHAAKAKACLRACCQGHDSPMGK